MNNEIKLKNLNSPDCNIKIETTTTTTKKKNTLEPTNTSHASTDRWQRWKPWRAFKITLFPFLNSIFLFFFFIFSFYIPVASLMTGMHLLPPTQHRGGRSCYRIFFVLKPRSSSSFFKPAIYTKWSDMEICRYFLSFII